MGDNISRDKAIARLTKVEVTNRLATMTDAKREIAEMPAADVAPVVHGRWNADETCSVCGEKSTEGLDATKWNYWFPNYCPNCGAKMDGGADNGKTH